MRGRKPIPDELKRSAGAAAPADAVCTDPPPPCPDWLDAEAQAMWGRLAADLTRLRLLSHYTAEAFAGYCQCYSQWRFATEEVRKTGLIVPTGRGMLRVNPAAAYANEMAKQMRSFAAEFGLTPAARARAGVRAENPDADDMADFLDA